MTKVKVAELIAILGHFSPDAFVTVSVDVSDDFVLDEKDPEWSEEDEAGRRVFGEVVGAQQAGSPEVLLLAIKGVKNY